MGTPEPTPSPSPPREWAPRIWEGMDGFAWLRLLTRNRFAVELPYWYIAAIVSAMTTMNMVLRWVEDGLYGDRVRRTAIRHDPIFVIGHWRTGTTLLHELLMLDDRLASPDTFACFVPNHSLISEPFFKKFARWMVPDRRPMDNMTAGWERPQEDEFGLCLLGLPSSYADIAFPNRPSPFPNSLDLSGLSPNQRATWKRAFYRFVQRRTLRDRRRLVLKSPPHTARIPVLLELFPGARFVHIVRNPAVVFPSTINLWQSLARRHGLQKPRDEGRVREKVLNEFRVIYDRLEEARPLIPAGHFHELRYEDLVANPVEELAKVYAGIGLEGFERVRGRIDTYLTQTAGYETNRYELSAQDRSELIDRWGDIAARYRYDLANPF